MMRVITGIHTSSTGYYIVNECWFLLKFRRYNRIFMKHIGTLEYFLGPIYIYTFFSVFSCKGEYKDVIYSLPLLALSISHNVML